MSNTVLLDCTDYSQVPFPPFPTPAPMTPHQPATAPPRTCYIAPMTPRQPATAPMFPQQPATAPMTPRQPATPPPWRIGVEHGGSQGQTLVEAVLGDRIWMLLHGRKRGLNNLH